MTQNPFGEGGNPFGNLDLGAMLEQAQQMQAQLAATQEALAATTVDGSAGGVTVTVSGVGELTGVNIALGAFDGNDPESLTDLADLVVAAFRDAKGRADQAASAALGPMAGMLDGSALDGLGELGGAPRNPLGFGGPPGV